MNFWEYLKTGPIYYLGLFFVWFCYQYWAFQSTFGKRKP
ncbi:hypothetical protein CLV58_1192 [Spirosoma oryzae]|uniref:Uncharacterized protein n=1 Tax=Spirosoma oryzae TaxID=1469603 RepID=A0A2T0SKE2_9BACT|nr:hypothetical protein CLV58_1192 [Spirosoma oryzae]